MWIVFGTKAQTTRVPGGAKLERQCSQCGETATFYEKELVSTFRLYFIDVFDYKRHRVMACGCCGACYATDELGIPGTRIPGREEPLIGEQIGRAVGRAGDYVERAATAVESGLSGLFSERRRTPAPSPLPPRPPGLDEEIDLLADDPMEARFRELERKAREQGQG